MTVEDLIKVLKTYPKNLEIILQKDPEGNGYSPAYSIGLAIDDEDMSYPDAKYAIDEYEGRKIPSGRVVIITPE